MLSAIGLTVGMKSGINYLRGFMSDVSDDVSWVDASVHLSGSVLGGVVMGAMVGAPIWAFFNRFPADLSASAFITIAGVTVLATAGFTVVRRFWFSVTMLWTLGAGLLAGLVALRIGLSIAGRGLSTLVAVLGDPTYTSADFLGGLVVGILAGGLAGVVTGTAMMFGYIEEYIRPV